MKNLIILLLLLTMKSYGQSMTLTPNGQQFSIRALNFPNNNLSTSQVFYLNDENQTDGKGFYSWNGTAWVKIKQTGHNNIPQTAQILSETISNNNLEGIGITKTGSLHFDFEGWEKNITSNSGFNLSGSNPIYNNNGEDIIFWGGSATGFCFPQPCNSTSYYKTGSFYSHRTDTWTALPTAPAAFGVRANHTTAYSNFLAKMIIWGGFDGTNYLSDMAILTGTVNPENGVWSSPSSNNSPSPRAYHSAMVYPNANPNIAHMLVWGGKNGTQAFSDGKIFTINSTNNTTAWATTNIASANAPTARYDHSMAYYSFEGDIKMVIFGGKSFGGSYLDNGAIYDISANSWTPISTVPSGVYINDGTAFCSSNTLFVVHASKYNTENLGAILNIQNNTWTTITDINGPQLKNHSIRFHPLDFTKLVVIGGTDKSTNTANKKVYTYDLTNAKWLEPMDEQPTITPISTLALAKPFLMPVGTSIDSKLFVWKPNGSTLLSGGIGGMYKPISDKTFFTFEKR